MATWVPGDDEVTFEFDNRSSRFVTRPGSGFVQFGDGEPIPVTNVEWTLKREPAADAPSLPLLSEFEGMIPLPTETAVNLLRAVGLPSEADRFEIAAHPDLAELNAQMDGYYGE